MTEAQLVIHFLDIGHGDTILGILPQGKSCFIVDVAEATTTSKMLVDFVEVEFVIITHTHVDHVGGLHALVRDCNVIPKVIYLNYDRGPSSKSAVRYKILLEQLFFWYQHYGIEILPVHSGISINSNDVIIDVLAPNYAYLGLCISKDTINDASAVIRVDYLGKSLILTGDIEAGGITQLIAGDKDGKLANIDILKVPHHGGFASEIFSQFVEIIKPRYAVICLAKTNKYDHPNKELIELLEEKAIEIIYTYEHPNEPHPTFILDKTGITLRT